MNQKKKKKINLKVQIKNILNSYKTIIYISFALNIILLITCYNINASNQIFTFSGNDDYLKVKDGIIALNNDINIMNGNNIEYIYEKEYDIVSYKIGYYVMDGNKLIEIVSNSLELETEIKISEIVKNFTSFNISEKHNNPNYFTPKKKELLNEGLYLVLDAKTKEGNSVYSKVKLTVSKVTKF